MSKPPIIIKESKNIEKPIIVVSKKVSKKAVVRNKLKRQIREILKDRPKKVGQNHKIFVNPEAKNLSFQELKKEINKQIS